MGQRHCRVYSNMRHARLVGIVETDALVGNQMADLYEVKLFDHVDGLLDHVDAVSLAVPTPLHFDLTLRCLSRGVHVLVEKPITETLDQAEELVRAAEASGLIVQVGHIERFNPTYLELKNVLEDMTVLAITARRLSPFLGSNTDVDVILDLMIHDIDLMLDLAGTRPLAVDAHGLTAFSGVPDHVIAHLRFASGPLISMLASRITEQKIRCIEVTAKEAYIEADLLNKSIAVHRRTSGEYLNQNHRGIKYRQESLLERIHVPIFEPLFLELQHFVECILEGKPSLVPAAAGLDALRLALAVYDSVEQKMINAMHLPEPASIAGREPVAIPFLS